MKLTAIIITKNEEENIADCIASVSFADEVLVVDAGSTDETVAIAKKAEARVIFNKMKSFAEQRTYAAKQAKGKWLLYVDSDERVSNDLKHEILKRVQDDSILFHVYKIRRRNYYLGKHEWSVIEQLERLILKSALKKWEGDIHETAVVEGNVGELTGKLIHYTHTNLYSMTAKTIEWAEIESDLIFKSHHPPMVAWRFIRIMATKFFDSYIKQGGWKIRTAGIVESMYQAYSYAIIYARVWERQNGNR